MGSSWPRNLLILATFPWPQVIDCSTVGSKAQQSVPSESTALQNFAEVSSSVESAIATIMT